jgi:hypothetical protein
MTNIPPDTKTAPYKSKSRHRSGAYRIAVILIALFFVILVLGVSLFGIALASCGDGQ